MSYEPVTAYEAKEALAAATGGAAAILTLNNYDVSMLRRLLRREVKDCRNDMRKNERRGWKPEPGHLDLARTSLEQAQDLLARLGYPDDTQKGQ
jgi:hypothetical protein